MDKVDVLAVMDCAAETLDRDADGSAGLREARAAVAELIEAADEASVALGESMEHTHQLVAHMRLCAALARVKAG